MLWKLCFAPRHNRQGDYGSTALAVAILAGREITLIIDETGDRKKGEATDYVKRQYIGNLGKIEKKSDKMLA
jgi:DDE superfamily endonuclease